MILSTLIQIVIYFVVLLALVKPLGWYMARVYEGEPIGIDRVLGPVERFIYALCGVKEKEEMDWKTYALALILFSAVGVLMVYGQQRLQNLLPLNPQNLGAVTPDSSFNTAISFVSNTNWQGYGGEVTMSYFTQMLGLATQNFLSAATGMAVLVALIRGLIRRSATTIGNFWVDLVRSILYILLPMSLVLAVVLVAQGVPQSFDSYQKVALLQSTSYEQPKLNANGNAMKDAQGNPVMEKIEVTDQIVPLGPVASQIAIKQLGTNGGGYYNVNSAHPLENPTPLSNFLEMLSILMIPAALCYTFGIMVRDTRQGWALLITMSIILIPLVLVCTFAEQTGNPGFAALGIDQTASADQPGGNMEGKEARFGIGNTALWASVTAAASNGSVNGMHDSFTPMGGLVPLFLMQLGEVIFGGVGSGLYGMLIFGIITVFISGLMVGRTPEYLGKKIEAFEMKMASLVILIPPFFILGFTALALVTEAGRATIYNPAAHGFSEVLYAFTSQTANNGSAFAGLGANNPFYNTLGGIAMFVGRFWLAIPVLAIAGSLAAKKTVPDGAGTLPTHTPLFVTFLIGVILIVGVLTFVPALALGPIVEQLQMTAQ